MRIIFQLLKRGAQIFFRESSKLCNFLIPLARKLLTDHFFIHGCSCSSDLYILSSMHVSTHLAVTFVG